jgi:predicted RND superfamily exporter protein
MTPELQRALVAAGYTSVEAIAEAEIRAVAEIEGYDLVSARQLRDAALLDRSPYTVRAEWRDTEGTIHAQIRRRGLYERPELWVRYAEGEWVQRVSGTWSEGPSFALASGVVGLLAASNQEVARSNNAVLITCFTAYFLMILVSYRSLGMAVLLLTSLGTAALVSIAFMWVRNMGFDVNTLPVQALGVGIGDDYALYIMDRVMRERKRGHGLLESVHTAIRTTGMAIFFTGTTLVGGIIFWYFLSSLRFAAEMSLLLSVLLVANLFGAIVLVPAFTALFKPRYVHVEVSEAPLGEPLPQAGR